jgi:hypothetical protein
MLRDLRTAYLFQCGSGDLFAVSHDKTGGAIPSSSCSSGWQLRQNFQLGMQDPLLAPIEPESIIRGIAAEGYTSGVTHAGHKEQLTGSESLSPKQPQASRQQGFHVALGSQNDEAGASSE